DAEPIRLRLTLRNGTHRRNVLAGRKSVGSLPVGEEPAVRRRGTHDPPEPRAVTGGEAGPAVAVALLECRRELDVDERVATESLHDRRLETAVGQHTASLILELLERADAPGCDQLLRGSEAVDA